LANQITRRKAVAKSNSNTSAIDSKTIELIRKIKEEKDAISKIETGGWNTSCSFSFNENRDGNINLHVETNVQTLVRIATFLLDTERSFKEVAILLNVEVGTFTWQGFPVSKWISDIRTRINKLRIASRTKDLQALEARLDAIISPNLRAELELKAIESELK
jgi:hypothetical protein